MKTISVSIKLEMEVPDDWELVESSEGIEVISMGNGQYLDLTFEPMVTDDIEGTWTNSVEDDFLNDLLEMVVSEEVTYGVSDTATP